MKKCLQKGGEQEYLLNYGDCQSKMDTFVGADKCIGNKEEKFISMRWKDAARLKQSAISKKK